MQSEVKNEWGYELGAVLILQRFVSNDYGTFGALTFNGQTLFTCEDPWNDNQKNISCIPAGEYTCFPYSSQKYPDVWEVMNVPDRSKILIHAGNTTLDTEGCILPGKWFGMLNGRRAVLGSRDAVDLLRDIYGGQTFKLAIRGPQ